MLRLPRDKREASGGGEEEKEEEVYEGKGKRGKDGVQGRGR